MPDLWDLNRNGRPQALQESSWDARPKRHETQTDKIRCRTALRRRRPRDNRALRDSAERAARRATNLSGASSMETQDPPRESRKMSGRDGEVCSAKLRLNSTRCQQNSSQLQTLSNPIDTVCYGIHHLRVRLLETLHRPVDGGARFGRVSSVAQWRSSGSTAAQ